MAQVLDCIANAPDGITRVQIETALRMNAGYSCDLLQSLRLMRLIESTGGKYAKWHLIGKAPEKREALPPLWEETPPLHAYKAPGTWRAEVKRANTWHPETK